MRSLPLSQYSSSAAKWARLAAAAGVVAGLAVLGACTDSKTITAPVSPRNVTIQGTGFINESTVKVCVDASSPAGTYKFTNSGFLSMYALNGVTLDGANGGDGTTVENVSDGIEYEIAVGACQVVLTRTVADTWHDLYGYPDTWSGITVQASTIPGAAAYSHTDCYLDSGTKPAIPNPCDTGNNPTRAYAQIHHGTVLTFFFVHAAPLQDCVLGYPNNDNLPQSAAVFNESEVLAAYARIGSEIRLWYTDEHALTLGVRQLFVNNKSIPDVTTNYTIATMGGLNPSSAIGAPFVNIGSTLMPPVEGAAVDPAGRPLFPAVFITDITDDATSRSGDWQMGGSPFRPNEVYGTWKGAVISIDKTRVPFKTTMTPDADPAKNHLNVGVALGANAVPAGVVDLGYSSEVVWSVAGLGLNPDRNYRLQFMVHDGDQNKTGGDVGQACMNIGPAIGDRTVVN